MFTHRSFAMSRHGFRGAFGDVADVSITGVMSLLSRTLEAAIRSAAQSYLIAFCVITLMMIALIGRLGTGLISMLPNLAPIVLTLALMQVAGIPLNLFTNAGRLDRDRTCRG